MSRTSTGKISMQYKEHEDHFLFTFRSAGNLPDGFGAAMSILTPFMVPITETENFDIHPRNYKRDGSLVTIKILKSDILEQSDIEKLQSKLRIAEMALKCVAAGIWRDKKKNMCGLSGAALAVHLVEEALEKLKEK